MKSNFYLTISIGLLSIVSSWSQLSINLNIDPYPTPKVIEWALNSQIVTLTVSNLSAKSIGYKIKAQFYKDGELIAETKTELTTVLSIDASSSEVLFAEDVVPERALKFYGNIEKTIAKTNKLPAGNYRLCVKLLDELGKAELTSETCQPFIITSYQQARLILPQDETVIPFSGSVPNLTFQWSPIVPQPQFPVVYKLRLTPKNEKQNNLNAFRYNTPIFEVEVYNSTSQIWPIDALAIEPDQAYVWAVRSEDQDGNPIGENDGLSEIWGFRFDEDNYNVTSKTSGNPKSSSSDCQLTLNFSISTAGITKYPNGSKVPDYVEYQYVFNDNVNDLNNNQEPKEVGGGKKKFDKYTIGKRIMGHKYVSGNCPNVIFQDIDHDLNSSNQYRIKILVENCKSLLPKPVEDRKQNIKSEQYKDIDFVFEVEAFTDLYKNGEFICRADTLKRFRFLNGNISEIYDAPENENLDPDCELMNIELPVIGIKVINSQTNKYQYNFSNIDPNIGSSLEPKYTFEWDFGDGNKSIQDKPINTYSKGGSYVVTMVITRKNSAGIICKISKKRTIEIGYDCSDNACQFNSDNLFNDVLTPDDSITLCGGLKLFINGNNITKGAGNKLSGKGIVYIPWLLTAINVEFYDLVINLQKEIVGGEINAIKNSDCPAFPVQWAINAGYQLIHIKTKISITINKKIFNFIFQQKIK